MITFLICLALLVGAYFTYGRYLERLVKIDPKAETPCHRLYDGVDYVPLPRWRTFLIQLLNIAGTGPIFGAILGACFGPLTGFAMNAARDFGPRLFATLAGWGSDAMTGYAVNSHLSLPYFLVPLIAPIIGACIGAAVYKYVIAVALSRQQS